MTSQKHVYFFHPEKFQILESIPDECGDVFQSCFFKDIKHVWQSKTTSFP